MSFIHAAVETSSVDNARMIFRELLGLAEVSSFNITDKLSSDIFELKPPDEIMLFEDKTTNVFIEVFINSKMKHHRQDFTHLCFTVDNLEVFLETARAFNLKIIQTNKEDRIITFIRDKDNNLYEIKQSLKQ
ncbi:MAG: hypothetical protein P9L96_01400 [Candidatus Gygaella obscura]|nr:hypothetical protein [Candidatus Gygaella obscura]